MYSHIVESIFRLKLPISIFSREPPSMLVFRSGVWHDVLLPFSDPMLTKSHLASAASTTVNQIMKGASFEVAVATAEKIMYEEILGISREQHNCPKNKEK